MISVKKKLLHQGGSLLILLPKIWTDAKGLKPHDEVEIILDDNMTIMPLKAGAKQDG